MRTPSDPGSGDPDNREAASHTVSTEPVTAVTPPGATSGETAVGSTWAHLRVLEELGRGGFGRVFRAWDSALAREVALKIIRLESAEDAALSAVLREGQMLARIRHRHVVTVFGAQRVGREVGVWMELVRGRTLAQMIREDGPLGPEEAAIVGMTICDALAAVHGADLVHRDIKAQNVMRESGGRIVLMDFGAGVELMERRRHPELVGTPLYMSPAVLAGAAWSPTADLYSVGVLLFYLVSGRFPVEGKSMGEIATAHALGEQKALADVRPGLPEGFSRVVRRALSHRYKSAGAMMRDLAEAIPGHESTNVIDSPVEVSPRTPMTQTPLSTNPSTQFGASRTSYTPYVAGGAAAVWALGILTSAIFNHSLGRDPSYFYKEETLLADFVWGVRALFPPALYMLMALIVVRVLLLLWRSAVRFVPPLTRFVLGVRRRSYRAIGGVPIGDNARLAQLLLAGQVMALGIALWIFSPYITAYASFLDVAPPHVLAVLGSEGNYDLSYRIGLSLVILAMGFGWWRLLSTATDTDPVDRTTMAAGLGVIALAVALVVAPFRLEAQEFEVAFYKGQRCSVMGERSNKYQLFCPALSPRVRDVSELDAALELKAYRDFIFRSRHTVDSPTSK
jgi:serine/threonine protein kinase